MVIISGDPKYHLYRPSLSEACVSYGFLCEPFWLKLDPGVRRKCMRLRQLAWTKYKRVARPFPWISLSRGPTGPLITFPSWTRPSVLFKWFQLAIMGPM